MRVVFFITVSFLFCNICFAERYIQSTKYENQEEIFIRGGSAIASDKINYVLMYKTSNTIINRKGNFYFELANRTEKPIHFYLSNLRVTDQWGRPVRIVSKNELIANKKSSKDWDLLASSLRKDRDTKDAQNAGNVSYQSQSNCNMYGSGGCANEKYSSTATVHVEALSQLAKRQAQIDAQERNNIIQSNYEDWEYCLNNFYLETTTVFPGHSYAANFQIDMHKDIEKDLQYLLFTYDIGGEEHTFCFYCGREKKKWYRFGL